MTEAGTRKRKPPAKVPSPDDAAPGTDQAAAAEETRRPDAEEPGPGDIAETPVESSREAAAAEETRRPDAEEPGPGGAAATCPEEPPEEAATGETEPPTAALRAELEGTGAPPDAAGGSAGERESPAAEEPAGEPASAGERESPAAEEPAGEPASAGERESKGPSPARVEYDDATLVRYVEALLFVSQHPLTVAQVARPLRTTFAAVRRAFRAIGEAYAERGVRLMEVGGGYQFRTAPECADIVRRFLDVRPLRLSKAALEMLAVIAYRQPVTKPGVDEIRGVDSGSALKLLLDRNLVRVLGRKEEPGRPLLYGTTQAFLEFFNLPSLGDLPSLREYAELTEDGRRQLERDLFARSPEALGEGAEGGRLRAPRRWEDLVEVLGEDLGGLPEGVEIEAEPTDPLEAYLQDDTFPRPPTPAAEEEAGGPETEGGPDDEATAEGAVPDEAGEGGEIAEDGGMDDVPEDAGTDDDDRP